jgi:AraC-like DNA-binding protein
MPVKQVDIMFFRKFDNYCVAISARQGKRRIAIFEFYPSQWKKAKDGYLVAFLKNKHTLYFDFLSIVLDVSEMAIHCEYTEYSLFYHFDKRHFKKEYGIDIK